MFFLIVEVQLIKTERLVELENHPLAATILITVLGKTYS